MSNEQSKDLVVVTSLVPAKLFTPGGIDAILKEIEIKANDIDADIATGKGRSEIASMAHKVARSKTLLDDMGKELVAGWKKKAKAVDIERKRMRDHLDDLKTTVRQPLTEWEHEEKARVEDIREEIERLYNLASKEDEVGEPFDIEELKERLSIAKSTDIDESFAEFANEAAIQKDKTVAFLEKALATQIAYQEVQAELERLRKEEERRTQKERDERIAKEAAERATKEAEEKAQREKEEAENKRLVAIQAEKDREEREKREERERAEAEKLEALAKKQAAIDKLKAEQEERERIALAKEQEERARKEDEKHRERIEEAIIEAILRFLPQKKQALSVVAAISKGEIPYLIIKY